MLMQRILATTRLIWAVMLFTSLGMPALVFVEGVGGILAPGMVPMLYAAAVVVAAASFVVPRIMRQQALQQAKLTIIDEPVGEAFPSSYREVTPKQRIFADRDAAIRVAAGAYQPSFLLSVAMSESIGMFGFLLAFLGAPLATWMPLYVAGAVLIAIRFPTERRIIAPLEEKLGALLVSEPEREGQAGWR